MDIIITNADITFNVRTCCIVYSKTKKEILVQRKVGEPEESWALPGGRVKLGESSKDAISRELNEEFAIRDSSPKLITVGEQVIPLFSKDYHQIIFVYKLTLDSEIPRNLDSSLEYKWSPVKDMNKIHPTWADSHVLHSNVRYFDGC